MNEIKPPPLPDVNKPLLPSVTLYVCTAITVFPGLVGITFAKLVLLPKLKYFQTQIATVVDHNSEATARWLNTTESIFTCLPFVPTFLVGLFVACEFFWPGWQRRRHWAALGVASMFSALMMCLFLWISIMNSIMGPMAGVLRERQRAGQSQAQLHKS